MCGNCQFCGASKGCGERYRPLKICGAKGLHRSPQFTSTERLRNCISPFASSSSSSILRLRRNNPHPRYSLLLLSNALMNIEVKVPRVPFHRVQARTFCLLANSVDACRRHPPMFSMREYLRRLHILVFYHFIDILIVR